MRHVPKAGATTSIDAAERRAEVVKLRRQRLTFDAIGKQLGITAQRAFQIYRAALAAVPAQQVDEHRAEELGLIDDAIRDLLDIALDHDRPRTAVEAWGQIRGWAERKAKLLGLDAPTRHEVVTLDVIDAEIARLTAELGKSESGESETGEAGAAPRASGRTRTARRATAAGVGDPG